MVLPPAVDPGERSAAELSLKVIELEQTMADLLSAQKEQTLLEVDPDSAGPDFSTRRDALAQKIQALQTQEAALRKRIETLVEPEPSSTAPSK